MSYEFYKILHIVFIVTFFAMSALSLYGQQLKHVKIIHGVATLFIFVTGMGLMARLGVGHGTGWPLWIKLKMTIWLLLAIAIPVVAKRFSKVGVAVFWVSLGFLTLASFLANTKVA